MKSEEKGKGRIPGKSNNNNIFVYICIRLKVFCKKFALKNFAKFAGKHLCQSLFFNKVTGLRHRCFPVNFAKFLRANFLQNTFRRMLLYIFSFKLNFARKHSLKKSCLYHKILFTVFMRCRIFETK